MENNKKSVINFFKVMALSLAAFLCVCWTAGTDMLNAYWSEAVVYFAVTYFLCNHFAFKGHLRVSAVVVAIAIGRVVLELPIRILHFSSSIGSVMLTLESLVAIFMAWVCWKYKTPVVFILTLVIFILINSFVPEMWSEFLDTRRDL